MEIKDIYDVKIPVYIGVTGHRSFRYDDRLKTAIESVLNEIRNGCDATEFVLLTALAAGADQLVAQVARSMGMKYAVVLPMARDKYFGRVTQYGPDFTPEEKKQAQELMNDPLCQFVYEIQMPDDASDDDRFREVGHYISDNSYAGIAIWDGRIDSGAEAGTGVTVRDSLHGVAYRHDCFPGITIPETRPIYHIYTPRENDTQKHSYDYKVRRLFPEPLLETGDNWFNLNDELAAGEREVAKCFDEKQDKYWRTTGKERAANLREHLKAINDYNRDVEKYRKYIERSEACIESGRENENRDTRAEVCNQYFAAADSLTLQYQKRRHKSGVAIILLAGLSYAFLNVFSDLFDDDPVFLLLYILLLIAAFAVWKCVDKKRYHDSFTFYRALSEAMRVQYFWCTADIKGNGGIEAQVEDYYLRRQKSYMERIRYAIRFINLKAKAKRKTEDVSLERVKEVSDAWLGKMDRRNPVTGKWEYPIQKKLSENGQSGYFLSKSLKRKRDVSLPENIKRSKIKLSEKYIKSRNLNAAAGILMALSLALVFGLMLYLFDPFGIDRFLDRTAIGSLSWYSIVVFVSGLLPIIAMVLREINSFMGYTDDVERYAWYHSMFKRAIVEVDEYYQKPLKYNDKRKEQTEEEARKDRIQTVLFEVGKEALAENAEWVMINESRSPEVPSN